MLSNAVLVASGLVFVFAETPGFCQAKSTSDPTQVGHTWEVGRPSVNPEGRIGDPAMVGYCQQLVDRVVAAAAVHPVQVRLTRSGQEYVSLRPKRVLSISSALAARLENEAQFAGLIAHELAHDDLANRCVMSSPTTSSWPVDQRARELAATASAISVLKIAGFDPEPVLGLLSELAYEHPAWALAISPDDLLQLRLPIESESVPRTGYRLDSSAFLHFHAALMTLLGKLPGSAAGATEPKLRRPH